MTLTLDLLPRIAAVFMLMMARIGTMVMLMPGLGETSVPQRLRLSIALALTLMFFPLVSDAYRVEMTLPALLRLLAGELAVGFVIGATGRMLMGGLQTAGTVIANQLGLGFVTTVDPTQGQQGAIFSGFLALLAVTLIFASDLHHLVIAALYDSYTLFAPGTLPNAGDAAQMILQTVAGAFRIAIQISAPFLVFGLIFNAGLAVLSKLMPQMQVFFIALPATIMLGLLLFAFVVATMMLVWLGYLQAGLQAFVTR
ncbi:flagellar biosynthetic protein FliR [Labrys wisconsinensis]|uniref:Flagellar biosynthetic protein FliR n=1 Tax=Labrys wisconsinensis TaxID=425677 RepID=A0ABU0JDE1_9HYPH|nr:flagellar biosynthetic protein FliR [Labrys wisconsinensis]MDQ0471418.1 flagellar biosynthetic protein FliR [Labrys wisconsinensis]